MIRSIFGIQTMGVFSLYSQDRLYGSREQAEKHLPKGSKKQNGSWTDGTTAYFIKEFVLLETDEDVHRLETADAAAARLRNLRESEIEEEVNKYRNAIISGKELRS